MTVQIPMNPTKPFPEWSDWKGFDGEGEVGHEYKGFLVSSNGYMNLQLANTEEFIDGACTGYLGEGLVSCNNFLYIRWVTMIKSGQSDFNLLFQSC